MDELAKIFSGDRSAGFVNAVLDGVRREIAGLRGAGQSDARPAREA